MGWRNFKMYRVNYNAKNFGFVGWEVFTSRDSTVMLDCVKIACSQMSKQINEKVEASFIKL
jgi:hypothetical protein